MIDILLATYNGEKFLPDQLASIEKQTYPHINLIIRDDLSTDSTPHLIAKYSTLPSHKRLGVSQNFSTLLQASNSDYFAFCDQDDVWLPQKLELSLAHLQQEEKKFPGMPLLLHSDLTVVDQDLNPKAPSFWKFSGLNPPRTSTFNRLLVQNTVTGCTLLGNRALRDLITHIPEQALMHDWWLALVASAFGKIISLPIPMVHYRQHSSNTLGAQALSLSSLVRKAFHFYKTPQDYSKRIQERHRQAEVFHTLYKDILTHDKKEALEQFLRTPYCSWVKKKTLMFQYDFRRNGVLRNWVSLFLPNPF